MDSQFRRAGRALALFAGMALVVAGCGKPADPSSKDTGPDRTVAKGDGPGTDKEPEGDHSGWWCDEHGLPEEVCDLCSKRFRTAEKAKGNWCEHNRVKSSCFKCNPGLREKYAAEYKTKFGKNPPPIEGEK